MTETVADLNFGPFVAKYQEFMAEMDVLYRNAKDKHANGLKMLMKHFDYHPEFKRWYGALYVCDIGPGESIPCVSCVLYRTPLYVYNTHKGGRWVQYNTLKGHIGPGESIPCVRGGGRERAVSYTHLRAHET